MTPTQNARMFAGLVMVFGIVVSNYIENLAEILDGVTAQRNKLFDELATAHGKLAEANGKDEG